MIKILLLLTSVLVAMPVAAVDVAPRISDREIIESLAELKAGQKALEEKMDLRFNAMQEQIDQRFTAIDQRFYCYAGADGSTFTAVDQRFYGGRSTFYCYAEADRSAFYCGRSTF